VLFRSIGLVDSDAVELSNLQRQILFRTTDVDGVKVECARDAISATSVLQWAMTGDAPMASRILADEFITTKLVMLCTRGEVFRIPASRSAVWVLISISK